MFTMKGVAEICLTILLWFLLFPSEGFCQRVDCQWGPYSQWTSCEGCAKTRTRTRSIAVHSRNGGNPCFGETLETELCFLGLLEMLLHFRLQCQDPNVDTRVHCQWGPYGEWSECDGCSKTQTRIRSIAVYAQYGGYPCSGERSQTRSCEATKSCPLEEGCGNRFRCRSGMCLPKSLMCNGDQDCEEDNEDERLCESKRHVICPKQEPPPNVELAGVGIDVATGKSRGSVLNTKSFGGLCQTIESNRYRLPGNFLKYNFLAKIQNDLSDEMYQSEWHYSKVITKRETVSGTTTGYRNYDYRESDVRKRNFHLLVLKNDIEIATFQTTNTDRIMIAEEFWKALTKLPTVYNYAAYRDLITRFGTHYISEGSLGGSLRVIVRLESNVHTRRVTETLRAKECERVKRFVFIFPVYHTSCTTDSFDRSSTRELNDTTSVSKVYAEGGSDALIAALQNMAVNTPDSNWRSYTNWADSVRSFPKVVNPKLRPLDELVKEVHCAGVKKFFLHAAIEMYLSESDTCRCAPCDKNGVAIMENFACTCIPKPGSEAEDPNRIEVDGRWSCWSSWSSCSGTHKTRSRSCNNPAPRNGGQNCIGLSTQREKCDEEQLNYLRDYEPHCFDFTITPKPTCDNPPSLINGYVLNSKDTYHVGDRVEYRCITGFHLSGPHTFECTVAQTWSGAPDFCQLSTCMMPALAPGILLSPDKSNYDMGDSVTLSCPEGQQLQGKNKVTCNSNFKFSPDPTQVTCEQAPTISSGTSSVQCEVGKKEVRGKCVCKMPADCGPSLELCVTHPLIGSKPFTVCKMHAVKCMKQEHTIAENTACVLPARPADSGCTKCHPWETCNDQSNTCQCRASADCPSPGLSVCVRVGADAAPQTMSECEAGLRRCRGEQVTVVDIIPCP